MRKIPTTKILLFQILFVRLQIPPPSISAGRHYSTSKIALQQLAPKYPIISLILEWRRINTALTVSIHPICFLSE